MSVTSPAPFYMHVGAEDEDIVPAVPSLFNCCCQHLGVWCTAFFFPCVVFASTRANNKMRDNVIPNGVCAQCCSCDCFLFMLGQMIVPCCRTLIYAHCIEDKEPQCADCGACCKWWCCFSCKATQQFRVSAIPRAPLNSQPLSSHFPPVTEIFPAKHGGRKNN